MAANGIPSRRKSIAVTSNQNDPDPTLKRKRRAHSIAPGERISPAKARRPIAPRKSILKASNFSPEEEDEGSGEITRDFRAGLHDNTTSRRPSFARRVSFAEHTYVREYFKENKKDAASSSPAVHEPGPNNTVTNENAYPGGAKRRSSLRRSVAFSEFGEESMDMDMDETAPGPSAFRFALGENAIDEDIENEDYYYDEGETMEITEGLPQNIVRQRSLSLGVQPRRPLSAVPVRPRDSINPHDAHPSSEQDMSFSDDNVTSTTASTDVSQPLEYMIPLVKPPAPPTDAWLALRSVTHSGDSSYEAPPSDDDDEGGERDMELTNAIERLRAAGSLIPQPTDDEAREDSFASTEDSFGDDDIDNDHNQTINLTQHRRASMGAMSEVDVTEDMAMTHAFGSGIVQGGRISLGPVHATSLTLPPPHPKVFSALSSAPAQPLASSPPPPPPSVFSAPPSLPKSLAQATVPEPFNFTLPPKARVQTPVSPTKGLPSKIPTSPSKAQPSKLPTPVFSAPTASLSSPRKRPVPVTANNDINEDVEPEDRPSPTKKVAVSQSATSAVPRAVPASPSKKAPLPAHDSKKPSTARRPLGYFAQRKSLGMGVRAPMPVVGARTSPKKAGRMSVGHGMPSAALDVAAEKARAQREREVLEREASASPARVPIAEPAEKEPLQRETNSGPAGILNTEPAVTVLEDEGEDDNQDDGEMEEVVNPTAQWREDVVHEQSYSEDEIPPISIEQFFNMTGIRFMDEITAPRRSTIHPSALHPRPHSSTAESDDVPLAEYVVAMSVDVPQLELYTYVGKDLEAWIERSKDIFQEAEAEAEKITPELFREFVSAPEDGQAELLHQLKLIKVNTHGSAKSEWYDWKLQWVEQLYGKAEKGFNDLTADAEALEVINKQAQTLVPQLREEYEQVMRELEQEKACVAEIERCDQKYLSELKAEIAVQNAELEAFHADVAEGNAKLERLEEKLQELSAEKQEASTVIEEAERLIHIQKNSTNAEVFRLKDELESLQNLHLWHAVKIQSNLMELIYASTYRISIPCVKFVPDMSEFDIQRVEKVSSKVKDAFPLLTDLMLRMAKQVILQEKSILTTRQIIQRLSDYWSSCTQLRGQLRLLAVKYPLGVTVLQAQNGMSGFKVTATIVFRNVKAKALVSFILDMQTFASWPMSIGATNCEVDVIYGPIERDTIFNAVVGRLRQATPAENHACLLDACIEAMDHYS